MSNFLTQLKQALDAPLPGLVAQQKMSARRSNGQKFPFRHEGPAKQGGVALVVYPFEGRWYMPLTKRPEYPGVHSGQISFPGGKMEPDDADLTITAQRETAEEIGLDLQEQHVVGYLSPLYIAASHYEVLPVVFQYPERPEFNTDPREVASLLEVPLIDILDPNRAKAKEIQVRGTDIWAPFFDLNAEVVWGATAMMLNEFVEALRGVGASPK